MKQFFKFMFASALGTFISLFFVTIIFIAIIGGMMTGMITSISADSPENITFVPKNSVLHIKLDQEIKDRSSDNPFENFSFDSFLPNKSLGLNNILSNIKKAKGDERIKGIYLDLTTINTGIASIEEIRAAISDFKSSGKWVISYSEIYTQKSYYLASIADKIYLNPAGIMELRGLAVQLMFFKKALDKLDIDVQIIRHGKFKSAVEPFMLEKMSDANRRQMEKLVNSMWGSMLKKVAESRNLNVDEINLLADDLKIQNAKDALKYGFVDELFFKDEILAELRNRLEIESDTEIKRVSLNKYTNATVDSEKKQSKNEIAIVYASGDIVSGNGAPDEMGSETISQAIREARLDDNIKAIVLRVNSPGGSALASDIIWREVVLAQKAKPTVVSMGDLAASGGYYIACAADKIVASEKTITGSIGVFGIIPNGQGFFNNKLGITFDNVNTNKHSDIITVFRPLTAEEKSIIQIGVENIYDDFITKVAEGRNLTKEEVDNIGQGRVWSGLDAIEIGLVDEIGGMGRAIEIAQEMAEIDDYKLVAYPQLKDPLEQLILNLSGEVESRVLKNKLGESYQYYQKIEDLSTQFGIMTKMPFSLEVY